MTIGSFLIGTIVSQILFAILKIVFIGSLNLESWVVTTAFFIALAIVAIATVRRMGILNYIETIFLLGIWILVSLIVDYVVVVSFTSLDIYKTWTYWLTYIVMILAVMLFHKAFHVQVRNANAKK